MTIIIDSNYLFALKSKKDRNHKKAFELFKELKKDTIKPLITNNLVVSEIFTLTNSRYKGNIYYLDKYYELIWGQDNFFKIIQLKSEEYKDVYKILNKYTTPKRLLSFVDASLIFLHKKFNAKAILSFDSHFDGIILRL
jgi:predicted nucleic acid-binding protein